MGPHTLAFLHDSFRAYFCAEALLAQGYTPQQDLAGERYEEAVRFLHDLLTATGVCTTADLLLQLQQGWAYALHLHESYDPAALDAIAHVQGLLETHAHLLQHRPAEAQRWSRDIRRQQGRSLYQFLGDFRAALDVYALNYHERQAEGDEIGQIRELNAAAKVFHDTYDFPAALALFGHCLAYWEQARRVPGLSPAQARTLTHGLAVSLGALGETLLKLHDIHGAMACFEPNRALLAAIAGDIARADVRLADCAMALALQAPEAPQVQYLGRAEHYLQQAETSYRKRPHAWGFWLKSHLKLRLMQRRWEDVVAVTERCLPDVSAAFIKGYLLLYQGQAWLALEAPDAAVAAYAASATAFLQEHHRLEAAGAYLAQSAAHLYAGRDGSQSVYKATALIQAFQQQYATLRTRYFGDEIRRWWPTSCALLAQRCPRDTAASRGPLGFCTGLLCAPQCCCGAGHGCGDRPARPDARQGRSGAPPRPGRRPGVGAGHCCWQKKSCQLVHAPIVS